MTRVRYADPGYDDLSFEELMNHMRYENAELLGMTPSEIEDANFREIDEKREGSLDYPETHGRYDVLTPEKAQERRERVNQFLGFEERPSGLERAADYLRSIV